MSLDLESLLAAHLRFEEEILSSQHLPEMLSAAALEEAQRASAQRNRPQALNLATFFVHSLEQRRMARFRPFVHTATVAL